MTMSRRTMFKASAGAAAAAGLQLTVQTRQTQPGHPRRST